jgi:hypothetical protein
MNASTLVACKLLTACCPLASQFPALLPNRDWIWFWISAVGVDTFGARSAVKRANTVVEYWVTAIDTVYPLAICRNVQVHDSPLTSRSGIQLACTRQEGDHGG